MEQKPQPLRPWQVVRQSPWRRLSLFQRCILISLLLHVAFFFVMGLIIVSQQIIEQIIPTHEMVAQVTLETGEALEMAQHLRSPALGIDAGLGEEGSGEGFQAQKMALAGGAERLETGGLEPVSRTDERSRLTAPAAGAGQLAQAVEQPLAAPAAEPKAGPLALAPRAVTPLQEDEPPPLADADAPGPRQHDAALPSGRATASANQATPAIAAMPGTGSLATLGVAGAASLPQAQEASRTLRRGRQRLLAVSGIEAPSSPVQAGEATLAGAPATPSPTSRQVSGDFPGQGASTPEFDIPASAMAGVSPPGRSMAKLDATADRLPPVAGSVRSPSPMAALSDPVALTGARALPGAGAEGSRISTGEQDGGPSGDAPNQSQHHSAVSSFDGGHGDGVTVVAKLGMNVPTTHGSSATARSLAQGVVVQGARVSEAAGATATELQGIPVARGLGRIGTHGAEIAGPPRAGRGQPIAAGEAELGAAAAPNQPVRLAGRAGGAGRSGGSGGSGASGGAGLGYGVAAGVSLRVMPTSSGAGRGTAAGFGGAPRVGSRPVDGGNGQGLAGGGLDQGGAIARAGSGGYAVTPGGGGGGGRPVTGGEFAPGEGGGGAGAGGAAEGGPSGPLAIRGGSNTARPGDDLLNRAQALAAGPRALAGGAGMHGGGAGDKPGETPEAVPGNSGLTPGVVEEAGGAAVRLPVVSALSPLAPGGSGSAPPLKKEDDQTAAANPSGQTPELDLNELAMSALSARKLESQTALGSPAIAALTPALATAHVSATASLLTSPLDPAGRGVGESNAGIPAAKKFFDRSPQMRQKLVRTMGGSKESEEAVARALAYLAQNREKDGRWSHFLDDPTPGGKVDYRHDIALTGLATLCFLASDQTPDKPGPYRQTVASAIAYLRRRQKPDGDLRGEGNMYSHAIGTLALAEAAIMTGDEGIKEAALRGASFIVGAQNGKSGGWRYVPGQTGDTSVLGWQVMALHSAEFLGFAMPPQTRAGALQWFEGVSSGPLGMRAGYTSRSPRPAMTAQGAFTRMLLGRSLSAAEQAEVCDYLLAEKPLEGPGNFYLWYYCSLAMMQMQNEAWEQWNPQIREHLIAQQVRQGPRAGSWAPDQAYGYVGGRIYSTALATLTLEVYYRYLPMYQRAGGGP